MGETRHLLRVYPLYGNWSIHLHCLHRYKHNPCAVNFVSENLKSIFVCIFHQYLESIDNSCDYPRGRQGSDRLSWLCFYQTRSAWSVDQWSNKNHSPAYKFAPTVTKFCVMWEGLSLPHDSKFGNCRCKIVDSRAFPSWSLIHGLRWSGLIKAEPG